VGWLQVTDVTVEAERGPEPFPGRPPYRHPKLGEHTQVSYPVGHLSTMYWIGLEPGEQFLCPADGLAGC
jgi:hypothetical protein